MTSSSGVAGARDQSRESSQSDWSTKFCKLFWRVADKDDKHRQIVEKVTRILLANHKLKKSKTQANVE